MARARRFPGLVGGVHHGEVTDEMREDALKKTADVVGKLDAIRKRLELPVDQLDLVAETYTAVLLAITDEAQQRSIVDGLPPLSMAQSDYVPIGDYVRGQAPSDAPPFVKRRTPMPIRSTDRMGKPCKIAPGEPFEVISRPQCVAYRIEGIEIEGDGSHWIVDEIRVGNRSQFVRSGSLPGRHFTKGGMLADVRLETLQTAMDFVMVVRYVGPEKEGEEFVATAVGTEAI